VSLRIFLQLIQPVAYGVLKTLVSSDPRVRELTFPLRFNGKDSLSEFVSQMKQVFLQMKSPFSQMKSSFSQINRSFAKIRQKKGQPYKFWYYKENSPIGEPLRGIIEA
jgi:hypothetical protein